jgi:hypothetical protein
MSKRDGRPLVAPTAINDLFSDEHARIEEGAGGDHNRIAMQRSHARLDASHPPPADNQLKRFGQDQLDPTLAKEIRYSGPIKLAIRLDARPPNGGAFASVEHPAVNRRPVCGTRHNPIEDVEFANKVALANAPDGRIARHLPRIFGAESKQPDTRTATRRGSRSLASGVAGPDNQNVVHARALTHHRFTWNLLAETEAGEESIEHILNARATGNSIERRSRGA